MDRQASKTLIGAFVAGAVVLVMAGILIFGGGKLMKHTVKCVLFFKGSLQGLNVGSAVLFRGVKIGSVSSITIETDINRLTYHIPVIVEIDLDKLHVRKGKKKEDFGVNLPALIERGLRAQLNMGSLVTGQLLIELGFHPDSPVELIGGENAYPEIPTIPSAIQRISDMLNTVPIGEVIERLMSAVGAVEKFLSSSELPKIMNTLKMTVEDIRKLVQNIDSRIGPLATRIDDTVKGYGELARNVDSRVGPLAADVEGALNDTRNLVRHVDDRIPTLAEDLEKSLKRAKEALTQARKTLVSAEGTIGKESPLVYQLDTTLKEIATMARSIRSLADYLERNPQVLLYGKGKPKRR